MYYHNKKWEYLIEALGIEPYKSELNPLYKPKNPCSLTVVIAQSIGPLYLGTSARESSCNCVFTYSVGNVQQISRPPAIPPTKNNQICILTDQNVKRYNLDIMHFLCPKLNVWFPTKHLTLISVLFDFLLTATKGITIRVYQTDSLFSITSV